MKTSERLIFRFALAFMVCIYSAVQTVPALADDDAPPASDSQPQPDPASEESANPEEVIPQLPEGTDVVVLNESGDSLPLATQEAAAVVVEGDPMWCPAGVAPKPGLGGCSPSFDRFGYSGDDGGDADSNDGDGSLIDWLVANEPNKAGTIWVRSDYANINETANIPMGGIILNGLSGNLQTMGAYALTIQGGWAGTSGSKALDALYPYSYFGNALTISWKGAVTLNNIVMTDVVINAPTDNQALMIDTLGNIVVNNVAVQNSVNNDAGGVASGASFNAAGNITINNSSFINNEADGVYISSGGNIMINGLVADGNEASGATIENFVPGKTVTLKGFKQFNNNGTNGLSISSSGMITLSNVVANNNGLHGVYLNNTVNITGNPNAGITLTGTNYAMNNIGSGFEVYSLGAITVSNLNASGNDGSGAILDNCMFDGVSACNAPSGKAIKVSGVNQFNGNGSDGLIISSFGAISLSNVAASNNAGDGAQLNNHWSNLSLLNSTGTLTVTGYGMFQNNGGSGLVGTTYGNAVLANINASDNNGTGLYLEAVKALGGSAITLSGVNYFMENNDSGLELTASGTITLNNVTASWNSDKGAVIVNSLVPDKSYNVTLKGTNAFNHNGEDGLEIDTFGAILINNLTANDNGEDGTTGSGAILNNCSCLLKPVTITGYINTSDNLEHGLLVGSSGAITLVNVTAEWNGLVGAVIQNDADPAKAQPVTIKGTNLFNHNGEDGLTIYSYGAILINNLMALSNGANGVFGTGVTLDNCDWDSGACVTQTPKAVTITGYAHASDNEDGGLYIYSNGAVTLNNVTAERNGEDGVFIENMTNAPKGQAVTLKGSNQFNQNGEDGLDIHSMGAITANNISAFGNQNGAGARLDNNASLQPANVTLSGVNTFVGNFLDGLSVNSKGAVVLSRVTADGNGWDIAPGDGIYVDTAGSITLTCAVTTNQTDGAGYVLISTGNAAITIKGLYSAGNNNLDTTITTGLVKITNPCTLP